MRVVNLRCEYLEKSAGYSISSRPRLSWLLNLTSRVPARLVTKFSVFVPFPL